MAPVLVRILKRPGRTLEIIDEISNTKPPLNTTKISDALGMPRSNVSRVINNLASDGVTPKAMYSLKRLSVSLLSVLYVGFHDADKLPRRLQALTKSILKTSLGLLVTYFIPRNHVDEALSVIVSESPSYREVHYIYAEELVRPHPLLSVTVRELDSKVDPYRAISIADRLADDREYLSRKSVEETLSLLNEPPRREPEVHDSLDLLILSILERNVIASRKYVDKLIKGRNARRKYKTHLEKHVVPVSSYMNLRIFDYRNDMVLVFGRGGSCARDMTRLLMPYLYTAGILVGGNTPVPLSDWKQYDLLVTLSLPRGYTSDVVSWLEKGCNWDYFSYEVVNKALTRYHRIYTIPYNMFDKSSRTWKRPYAIVS